ncbi:DUF5686 family protein [Emticicia sp. SJ17W-69]|uniref:DUF5686 and carboxypeptidase-like regulatory domain-containing protein n=1 Tax=Emticicia sp. SJ17W-69 TaxID=3421657 RepID=UPI003EBD0F0F
MYKTLLIFLILPKILNAQTFLAKGKIIDESDQSKLSFVSIRLKNTLKGTQSDIEGNFTIKVKSLKDTLTFSFMGYESKQLSINELLQQNEGLVFLKQKNKDLNEVVVRPRENPAWEIIRRVLKNKDQNDPEKLDTYQYNSYSKIDISIDSLKIVFKKDTNKIGRRKSATYYIQENYSKVIYKKPAKKKETIIASIGNWPVTYTYIANTFPLDINPFGFYHELFNFTLLKRFYVNPINSKTFKQYDFELKDTLIHKADSTFIIAYKPYYSKNFEGLTGILQINSASYALENISAKPADTLQFTTFQINQQYSKIANQWFPSKSEITILGNYDKNKINSFGSLKITNVYKDIIINQTIENKLFDESNREMLPNATKISNVAFKKYRLDSLSNQEIEAYQLFHRSKKTEDLLKIDSIVNPFLMGAMAGVLEIGKVDILTNFLVQLNNSYEKIRIGIGLQNNQRLKPKFRMMGAVGYGIFDHKPKYQGIISWHITPDRYNKLSIFYENDYKIPANTRFLQPNFYNEELTPIPYSIKDSIPVRIDKFRKYGISLHFKPIPYTWWRISLENELRIPQYNYQFQESKTFQTSEIKLDIRFAYKEMLNRIGRIENVINRWYPIINLQFIRAIPNFNGNYNYWKTSADMEYQIRFKKIGFTTINLNGGYAMGKIPYPFLFGALGGRGTLSLSANNNSDSFKTLDYGAYLSDKYVSLTVKHNFGRTLIRPRNKFFQPSISIFNNLIYGALKTPEAHQFIQFSTFNKGYFEVGIEIKDLFRIPIKKIFIGSGLGLAYHYGASSAINIKENFRLYWLGILPSF